MDRAETTTTTTSSIGAVSIERHLSSLAEQVSSLHKLHLKFLNRVEKTTEVAKRFENETNHDENEK